MSNYAAAQENLELLKLYRTRLPEWTNKKEYTMSELYFQAGGGPESESWTRVLGIWAEEAGSRGERAEEMQKSELRGKARLQDKQTAHPKRYSNEAEQSCGCMKIESMENLWTK